MITGLIASRFYEIQMNMLTKGGDGPWSVPVVVRTDTGGKIYPSGNLNLKWGLRGLGSFDLNSSSNYIIWKSVRIKVFSKIRIFFMQRCFFPHFIDRLALPGPITGTSNSLPWKIAVRGAALDVVIVLLLFSYIYLEKKVWTYREFRWGSGNL